MPQQLTLLVCLIAPANASLFHFDVDVIDDTELPVADVPHKGGLSFADAIEALRVFLASPKTAGLVVTEFNPSRDPESRHARNTRQWPCRNLLIIPNRLHH